MIDYYKKTLNKFLENKNLYLNKKYKKESFLHCMYILNQHHSKLCNDFKNIISANKFNIEIKKNIENEFFLPVNLFKKFNLLSINNKKINKELNSSGTSGNVSKIYLDNASTLINNRVLYKILKYNFQNFNIPIIFIDKEPSLDNRFNARKAAIKGFSILSKNKYYLMDVDGTVDIEKLNKILESNEKAYIFGFTSILWTVFNKNKKDINNNLSKVTLIHGGGWKKMKDKNITTNKFNSFFLKNFKIKSVINYYGMVEQIGSIFFNCKYNFFHTHTFSDIVVRDKNLNPLPFKKKGLVQLISLLPRSYPGHSLLTEDIGTVYGEDNCKCGRAGKYFKIWGRLPKSEIRGCSDV